MKSSNPVERTDALPAAVDIEREVLERYQAGAREAQPGLCCPTAYDPDVLEFLPQEIIEKDYGCGSPWLYVNEGETVVDLGSGAGKTCYILSRRVGPDGAVIGVDFNEEMLTLSRKYLDEIGEKLGCRNVRFLKGRIQDLGLDLDLVQQWLEKHPVLSVEGLGALEAEYSRLRQERPLIPTSSVDVIVSNCVLNLVRPQDKERLFQEMFRILKRGGRAVISDIVCDEDPTPAILADPELWSGCISGAFREDKFLGMFESAGFYGIEILSRQQEPWQVIDGIEFRSMTVRALKGKQGPCIERNQAVVYRGPWKTVTDDDGHTFHRGQRMAVCDKTFNIMTSPSGPYHQDMVGVPPLMEVPLDQGTPFDCNRTSFRHPRETKGKEYNLTQRSDEACCGPDCVC
jgi:arsenite methyltransferase